VIQARPEKPGGGGKDSWSDSGSDDATAPKSVLKCMNSDTCMAVDLMRSQFLLFSFDGDDACCGHLYGTCENCSGVDWKVFKKMVRQRWAARPTLLHGRRERARAAPAQHDPPHVARALRASSVARVFNVLS
jgi:hypothetical protein